MSLRFRVKVGPIVYDEKLGGPPDRRPVLLKRGDFWVLGGAAALLVAALAMAVFGG